MAKIIEGKRRIIKMSADDVIAVVRRYQQIVQKTCCYEHVREIINNTEFYIPEDMN